MNRAFVVCVASVVGMFVCGSVFAQAVTPSKASVAPVVTPPKAATAPVVAPPSATTVPAAPTFGLTAAQLAQFETLAKLAEAIKGTPAPATPTKPALVAPKDDEAPKLVLAIFVWEAEIHALVPAVKALREAGSKSDAALMEWGTKAARLEIIHRARNTALARLAMYRTLDTTKYEDEAKKEIEEERKK